MMTPPATLPVGNLSGVVRSGKFPHLRLDLSKKPTFFLSLKLTTFVAVLFCLTSCSMQHVPGSSTGSVTPNAPPALTKDPSIVESPEGPVHQVNITVGPFDIHRKYRSMEGPWSVAKFKIGELVASGSGELPESRRS